MLQKRGGGGATLNVVPENSNRPNGKGIQVQSSTGNPFYGETAFEHFDGLGSDGMVQADSATKRVKGELARLYNAVKHENPEALEGLEFPPLPNVPTKGKKALKLNAYLEALDQYRATCEALLEGVGKATIKDEIQGARDAVVAVVETSADMVAETVVAMGEENLAATLGIGMQVLNGLSEIYNKIDTDTRTIITAVDKQGNRIVRTIDKRTNEIKDVVMREGQITRDQEFLNSIAADIRNAERIEGVHRHIDNSRRWIINDVNNHTSKEADKTRRTIETESEATRETVETEHNRTRKHVTREVEEHSVFWHGLPDPFGIWDKIFR